MSHRRSMWQSNLMSQRLWTSHFKRWICKSIVAKSALVPVLARTWILILMARTVTIPIALNFNLKPLNDSSVNLLATLHERLLKRSWILEHRSASRHIWYRISSISVVKIGLERLVDAFIFLNNSLDLLHKSLVTMRAFSWRNRAKTKTLELKRINQFVYLIGLI